jgi:hypothetical protein
MRWAGELRLAFSIQNGRHPLTQVSAWVLVNAANA